MSFKKEEVSIIRVREEDYLSFCRLLHWRRTGQEQGDLSYYEDRTSTDFLRKHSILNSNTIFVFAAKLQDKYVGYLSVILMPKLDPRIGILYIDELWVPEPYRQKGIATLLMKEVFKIAKELDLWRVRVYVGTCNEVARNYYKKVGFSEHKGDAKWCEVDVKDIEI